MQPLRFKPLVKRARWGGTRLGTVLHKPILAHTDAAESWELVDHGDDQSVVASGPFAGWTLRDLVRQHGPALLGRHAGLPQFPLLLKFLDARDRLSLQVHPNDAQAEVFRPGEKGKTEAWVILAADPGSVIYAGLKPGVDRPRFEAALSQGGLEECLHRIDPRPGDCVFIPAGTVHAVGEGVLLAEIQQTSDLTLRLDDWGRLGADGLPRPLHLAAALDCLDFERGPIHPIRPQPGPSGELLVSCPYFTMWRHAARTAPVEFPQDDRFQILAVLQGEARLECDGCHEPLRAGDTCLLPARRTGARLVPETPATVLEIALP
jgi:mannose-6-phosphate isomerase